MNIQAAPSTIMAILPYFKLDSSQLTSKPIRKFTLVQEEYLVAETQLITIKAPRFMVIHKKCIKIVLINNHCFEYFTKNIK